MKFVRIMGLLVLLGVTGVGSWFGFQGSDAFKLQEIKIDGATPATEARLRKNLKIHVGDPFWKLAVDQEVQNIARDSWVESVGVRRIFPTKLLINIDERKPFAVAGDGKGKFKYIDEHNNILGQAEPAKMGAYPVLLGVHLDESKKLREQAIDIIKSLPSKGLVSLEDVGDLQYDDEHGFQIRLSQSQILLDVGKENIPLHVDRARRVVQYLDQHGIDATRVDSDYAKKVLVKVRKAR